MRGIDKFRERFAGREGEYVLIMIKGVGAQQVVEVLKNVYLR